jgi:energy-coupling factor transport system ATP-binding protein
VIRLEKVSFSYLPGVEVLKDVTLEVREGDFLAVMGENGAGKTTLIKHFNGLLKPTQGRVLVDDVDTGSATVAELSRKVGLVFQNPDHQLFSETVEDEIAFALKNFGFNRAEIEERTDQVLRLLSLEEYRQASPLTLSGGEKKRVALASVLAWDPKYLIIDEPTIGQDYEQKSNLRKFLSEISREGRTVVVVTHDVEFVAECSCKILLMAAGRVIASGPVEEVLTDRELIKKGALTLPQLVEVFDPLSRLGFPKAVFGVEEASELLMENLRRLKRG